MSKHSMDKQEPSSSERIKGDKSRLTLALVREIAGELEDVLAAEIVATGGTVEDLEEAVAWAAGESDVMGHSRLRGSPTVAEIYDLLTADQQPEEFD